jgi:surface antigen
MPNPASSENAVNGSGSFVDFYPVEAAGGVLGGGSINELRDENERLKSALEATQKALETALNYLIGRPAN